MEKLNQNEHDILKLVKNGLKNIDIAETLNLSNTEIKSALETIYTKLGVTNRLQAAILFVQQL